MREATDFPPAANDIGPKPEKLSGISLALGGGAAREREARLGITGVMVEAFNIIQDRISRARLAGDPPDLSLQPKLGHIGLTEFHRADELIKIGYEATMAQLVELQRLQRVLV